MHKKFEEIYHEYKEMVYNLTLNYLHNTQDAEEVTQDVFIKVHKKMDSFKDQSSLKTWIYRISINTSLDFLKAKKRKKRFGVFTSLFHEESGEEKSELLHFDHPGVELEQKEALQNLFGHINQLPDNQKTALLLTKIEGQSQKEVGEIMNISPKAVESLLQRAKANLKKDLKNNNTNEG